MCLEQGLFVHAEHHPHVFSVILMFHLSFPNVFIGNPGMGKRTGKVLDSR
ncbi:MAG: hypothetical protein JETT_3826 [Candidatus Jettenia ecosi]|uniref:Uncharacterized protein n=1 Tax=Candidatus Jettenia ecosi TaxID=2494326 RepID=A0A533Q5T2_9BACT|nr:MAG: hypothetical protein JETT_3826 [Candidatus Jettenia ecosi]